MSEKNTQAEAPSDESLADFKQRIAVLSVDDLRGFVTSLWIQNRILKKYEPNLLAAGRAALATQQAVPSNPTGENHGALSNQLGGTVPQSGSGLAVKDAARSSEGDKPWPAPPNCQAATAQQRASVRAFAFTEPASTPTR